MAVVPIKAAIQAYAEDKITPAEMPMDPNNKRNSDLRYAPSFVSNGKTCPQVYTTESLAKFLGMTTGDGTPQEKFLAAFGALELIEQGYLKETFPAGSERS